MEKYVKKIALLILSLFVCIVLPNLKGCNKDPKQKTAKVVKQEGGKKTVKKVKEVAEL